MTFVAAFLLGIAFLCGIALVLYPVWARGRDPRPRVKWVLATTGLTVLCWSLLAASVRSPKLTQNLQPKTFARMRQVKSLVEGISAGLIIALTIQGELLPSRRKLGATAGVNTGQPG